MKVDPARLERLFGSRSSGNEDLAKPQESPDQAIHLARIGGRMREFFLRQIEIYLPTLDNDSDSEIKVSLSELAGRLRKAPDKELEPVLSEAADIFNSMAGVGMLEIESLRREKNTLIRRLDNASE